MIDKVFKDKYILSWCEPCNEAVIICQICGHSSCSGMGCKICDEDFDFVQEISKSIKTQEEFNNNPIFHW